MAAYSWTHGAWRSQTTRQAQRDMLALHIAEVEDRRDAISGSGAGIQASYEGLESKLQRLERAFAELDTQVRAEGGPMLVARLKKR